MSDVTKENNTEISLADIMSDNEAPNVQVPEAAPAAEKYRPVNPSAVKPAGDIKKGKDEDEKKAMGEILDAVGRRMDRAKETANAIKQDILEDMIESEAEQEEDDEELSTKEIPFTPMTKKEETDEDLTFEDPDIAEIEKELDEEIEFEKQTSVMSEDNLEELSNDIKKFIKPIENPIDLSEFSISSNGIPVAKAILTSSHASKPSIVADWVLVDTGRVISMRSFDSDTLEKLDKLTFGRTTQNNLYDVWNIIYEHCEDPNKGTLEEWLSGISYNDIGHIWATIFKASFLGNSYIPFECDDCGKSFIPGETPFEDFVKYKDETTKAYVQSIMNHNIVESNFMKPELRQITDSLVFAISRPSIYKFLFENIGLDDDTRKKYSDTVDTITYIANIFTIDKESKSLVPVLLKKYPGNRTKTTKAKLHSYTKLISTLTSDQRGLLSSSVSQFLSDTKYEVSYIYPSVECSKCHHVTKEVAANPNDLVFLRHKLATLMK